MFASMPCSTARTMAIIESSRVTLASSGSEMPDFTDHCCHAFGKDSWMISGNGLTMAPSLTRNDALNDFEPAGYYLPLSQNDASFMSIAALTRNGGGTAITGGVRGAVDRVARGVEIGAHPQGVLAGGVEDHVEAEGGDSDRHRNA